MSIKQIFYFIGVLVGFWTIPTIALQFPLPPEGNDLFGKIQVTKVKQGDDFSIIARRYDVGFYELVEANPQVDPDHPRSGTVLIVPTQYLLPRTPRTGIVLNLAAMRLFYFPKGKDYFYTYPIGIGRQNWNTPLGALRIVQKIVDPVWVVPDSIMKYRQEQGDPVPRIVSAGPDNPLGKYAMRLSIPTYLIHGTNDPSSVGRRSSAGCIHLYPEDIEQLFAMIPKGMSVLIINEPYEVGFEDGNLYVKAHLPLEEQREALLSKPQLIESIINQMLKGDAYPAIDWQEARETVQDHTGIPVMVGISNL